MVEILVALVIFGIIFAIIYNNDGFELIVDFFASLFESIGAMWTRLGDPPKKEEPKPKNLPAPSIPKEPDPYAHLTWYGQLLAKMEEEKLAKEQGTLPINPSPPQEFPILPAVSPPPTPIVPNSATPQPVQQVNSQVEPADFVREKLIPLLPQNPIEVDQMTYVFGEPENETDHSVKLYLALSQEERAIIEKHGLGDEAFEKEPLFDEDTLEQVRHAQEQELAATSDPRVRATLRIQHQQQLEACKKEPMEYTIYHYLAYPYIRTFSRRSEATQYRRKLERDILPRIKRALEEWRGK